MGVFGSVGKGMVGQCSVLKAAYLFYLFIYLLVAYHKHTIGVSPLKAVINTSYTRTINDENTETIWYFQILDTKAINNNIKHVK